MRANPQRTAAVLAAGSAAAFLVVLALLQVVRSDLDPTWRFISEYGRGTFGWMMSLGFTSLALTMPLVGAN